ncbi:hypothetical protein BCR44DRAFT_1429371 [Catenaria anguillulae PL171]|uniref:Uncharacterized protein n=1 Tax=Catenaria anguillulae PL171 TaxID=765915 RepID=A0A1Y2HTR1_9FUNG|nr:hypothetical protein BCR44DRAFT_1429371 [Catenaria anguillulae PL171]
MAMPISTIHPTRIPSRSTQTHSLLLLRLRLPTRNQKSSLTCLPTTSLTRLLHHLLPLLHLWLLHPNLLHTHPHSRMLIQTRLHPNPLSTAETQCQATFLSNSNNNNNNNLFRLRRTATSLSHCRTQTSSANPNRNHRLPLPPHAVANRPYRIPTKTPTAPPNPNAPASTLPLATPPPHLLHAAARLPHLLLPATHQPRIPSLPRSLKRPPGRAHRGPRSPPQTPRPPFHAAHRLRAAASAFCIRPRPKHCIHINRSIRTCTFVTCRQAWSP